MNNCSSLIGLLLLSVSSGAFAQQDSSCEVGTKRLRAIESTLFMEASLARTAAPANVLEESLKHNKSALCAQNAKNKSLHGNDISRYQQTRMNKNDAADIYSKFPA